MENKQYYCRRKATLLIGLWIGLVPVLLLNMSVSAQEPVIDSSYLNSHYSERLAFFRQMPAQKKEIVFLGNSITEAGEWQELLPGKHVLNRGISGDVTYGVLARLAETLSSRPRKLFVLIGVNDIKRGIPEEVIARNIERIILYTGKHSSRTQLYIQSVLPVAESKLPAFYSNVNNQKIRLLNGKIAALAAKYNVTYIDLNKMVFSDDDGGMKPSLTTDGLHLKASAYIQWVNYLKREKYL